LIDTEFLLGGEILKSAKSLANSLLGVDVSVDEFVRDFPHTCGGGWPDVHPDDAFVTYSQVTAGDFKGTVAMSRGWNQKIRMQGVAIGLVLSAVVTHGIGPEHHQHIVGFNELVEQAQAAMQSPIVEPEVTRTSSPAVGGSSRSSRNAHTADTVDRARARSRARGSLDDLIAKEKSQGSVLIKGKGKDKDMAAGGKGDKGGMGGNELTTEAEKEPEDYAAEEGDAEDGPALYQLSKPAAAGRSSRGKSKGSKRVAGGGSDSYGNTGKDGAGGGDDNDEEEENEERERTGLTRISKWEYVLMRVKDAQAKTEDALEILDKLETQLMDM
jgi:hypothetical protein